VRGSTLKILSIDIGAGTEDVLLYDSSKSIENCVKMVLPSPTLVYSGEIKRITSSHQNLLVRGDTIGGGAITGAIRVHLKEGLKVVMTEKAALTIRNNLEQVRSMGIEVVKNKSQLSRFSGTQINLEEINLSKIAEFLSGLGVKTDDVDVVAVGVQDHGVPPTGESNRAYRMKKMEELLRQNPTLEALAFKEDEVPQFFLRMRSAVEACKRQMPDSKIMVMDTSPCAVLGCLEDPEVGKKSRVLVVNAGNGHTIAAIVHEGNIAGLVEHHTEMLRDNPSKLEHLLIAFANGRIKGEDIFEDGGHGAFYLENNEKTKRKLSVEDIEIITVTGPNRSIANDVSLPIHYASPAGDVMMTGTMGLVRAVLRKLE
jgi:uncharacterized protein (DUF1786 family)